MKDIYFFVWNNFDIKNVYNDFCKFFVEHSDLLLQKEFQARFCTDESFKQAMQEYFSTFFQSEQNKKYILKDDLRKNNLCSFYKTHLSSNDFKIDFMDVLYCLDEFKNKFSIN